MEPFTAPTTRKEIPRDWQGRPLVPQPTGGKPLGYTRCTTAVGLTEDTFTLSQWSQRMVALGLARRPDLLAMVSATTDDLKSLNRLVEEAKTAGGSEARANLGTAIHAFTEMVDNGASLDAVPVAHQPDVLAYLDATDQLTHEHVETFMVHDAYKVGGTPDRLTRLPDGRLVVFDLKTGGKPGQPLAGMGKIAQQLAFYSRMVLCDIETGERTAVELDQAVGIVAHLPAGSGTCELIEVDLHAGWEGVELCQTIRDYRKRNRNPSQPFQMPTDPDAEPYDNRPDTTQEWLGLK